ncbi:hypothetical protein STCU_06875 [Strigomonas culicis]|uniref:Amastin n=1 Tax=Strigomonas culicis TaxID=28005 RepID=S9VDF6_9TRYP|nr:hypothetical protein STCU_06875 [Strigomonas culicis]|eukprot:EPY25036.1 hypothetical protein STCU_06875 [Strigomonas culicis]
MLAACCPVPWYTPVAGGSSLTLWRDASNTKWTNTDCSRRAQMFQAMEAFAIASCVSSVAALVAGVLQLVGGGHLGVTVGLGVFTTAMELVTWALCVNQFHVYNCPGKGDSPLAGIGLGLGSGFALTLAACGIMLFATIGVSYYLYAFFARPELHEDKYNRSGLTIAFLLFGCFTITVVGSTSTIWVYYTKDLTAKFTLWHLELEFTEQDVSSFSGWKNSDCPPLMKNIHVGQAFAIISSALLFVSFLLSVGAVYRRGLRLVTLICAAASWATLLVCWAVLVATKNKLIVCSSTESEYSSIDLREYFITDGLAMFIAAWCILVPTMILIFLK